MSPKRILLLVLGGLLALGGFGLLAGGGGLAWALTTQRDDAGFFATAAERYQSTSYAVTTERIDLGRPDASGWADRKLATVRLRATGAGERPLFVGVGAVADVEAYLAGVPHDELAQVSFRPFETTYRPQNATGTVVPTAPATQSFWAASVAGSGTQVLTWDVQPGRWEIVVMNADGARAVAADIEAGAKVAYLPQVMIGLFVAGALVRPAGATAEAGAAVRPSVHPVRLEGHLDPSLSRWQWLVKWFLVLPHLVVLAVLWACFAVLTLVAFVAIAFTGRYPRRIFDFNVGVLRWSWRVTYYATGVMGTDRYPPFTLGPVPDYPATLDIAYPAHLSRGLVWVKSWLLAIPHLVLVGLLTANWGSRDGRGAGFGGGLLGLLTLVAGVVLLVRGRYHRGVFDLLMGLHRWIYRVIAYVALMTDEYPPFRLDQGGSEPHTGDPLPPPTPPTGSVAPDAELVHH